MSAGKLRRRIAWEAARLMYWQEESEYLRAKLKAAKRFQIGWIRPADLPSNAEIRDEIMLLSRLHEPSDSRDDRLKAMRLRAAWWMEQLAAFHPRLIGSVLTGAIRQASDIDLHVFTGSLDSVTSTVENTGVGFEVQRKRAVKDGVAKTYTHIHVRDIFPVELSVYETSLLGYPFKCSITGGPIQRATLDQLTQLIAREHELSAAAQRQELRTMEQLPDRWPLFEALLMPLERVEQSRHYHPEGDALYHSLQVFELARDEMPYDEEFLLAALLHDIGKAIDPDDHVGAGLEALGDFISPRTQWLIAHHMEGHLVREKTIGARRRRRLSENPWFEDLLLLAECDAEGRQPGMQVDDVSDALEYIRSLETMFG